MYVHIFIYKYIHLYIYTYIRIHISIHIIIHIIMHLQNNMTFNNVLITAAVVEYTHLFTYTIHDSFLKHTTYGDVDNYKGCIYTCMKRSQFMHTVGY